MNKEKINLIAVIPANPGFYVLENYHHEKGDPPPKASDLFLSPIVAWSIERYSFSENHHTVPVTTHGRDENYLAIVCPNGEVDDFNGTWKCLQDFLDDRHAE